jgi:hypothetical protein
MRIVFFTEYGSNYKEIASHTVPVMKGYCARHGYIFRELKLEGNGNEYYYKKHEYISELFLEDIDAVFYLDVDAMPTNFNIKIESFLDNEYDFYITEHCGELNGGAIILKNNDGGNWVNDFILDRRNEFENEQNVINAYRNDPAFSAHMKIVPHPAFNSLNYEIYPELPNIRKREEGHHHFGDFILHTPGASMKTRIETLQNTIIQA